MKRYNEFAAKEVVEFDKKLLATYNLYLDKMNVMPEQYQLG
jgi:hypothetical protein